MPLTNIDGSKGNTLSYPPLLLAAFTFLDASVLRVATMPLNTGEGGVAYGGESYLGRVEDYSIGMAEGMSEQGIDITPNATVRLADADKAMYLNYEQGSGKGFKGARLALTFVLYDPVAGTFSSDSIRKFTGRCDGARVEGSSLIVSASSLTNLQKRSLPTMRFQRRCPLINPVTVAQRAEANDEDSPFYMCGETRDLVTAPPCKYTPETCTQPLRRASITYSPPAGGRSKEYVSGNWVDIKNSANEAKYGDFVPMVYGTAWVDAPVMNTLGDGNATRGEAVVCLGEVTDILRVVINDVEIPAATDIDGNAYRIQDPLFVYYVRNKGDRDGSVGYDGQGDPYGNMAAIHFVVHRRIAEAASVPRVRVLVKGPKVRVYSNPSTFTKVYSENPAWVWLDLHIRCGYAYADIDIQSVINEAAYNNEVVSYTNENGDVAARTRYTCSLAIREQRPATEVVLGLRRGFNAIAQPNSTDGKLQLLGKKTLAEQQASAIGGSNNGTGITSIDSGGSTATGYSAYDFSESSIIKDSLKIYKRPTSDSPNRVQFIFQDASLDYARSSMTIVDSDDIYRAGQEVGTELRVDGPTKYSHAHAIGQVILAETHRGNAYADTRGTEWYEFETSFRAVRLRIGQLCRISHARHGLTNVPFRIQKLQPSKDYETITILGHRHDDLWYTDNYKPAPDPRYSQHKRDKLARPAYPWAPNYVQPQVGNPLHRRTAWNFGLEVLYDLTADGNWLAKIKIKGSVPVNDVSVLKPPMIGQQGTTANSGGTIAGGGWVYYYSVCGVDADGLQTAHSPICRVAITVSGETHTATIPVISWDTATVGYQVFGGRTPSTMTHQATGTGKPSSITLTAFHEATYGVPDGEFDLLQVRFTVVAHAGVFGAILSGVGSSTLTITGAGWTTNEWAGYDVSVLYNDGEIKLADFRVTSNTADTLTVTPDPEDIGVEAGNVVTMLSKPTVSGRTLTDAKWENTLSNNGNGLNPADEEGRKVFIFAGLGKGQMRRVESATSTSVTIDSDWSEQPDSTSRYIILEPNALPDPVRSSPLANSHPTSPIALLAPGTNYRRQTLLAQVFTVDGGGAESVEAWTPFRVFYLPGQPASVITVAADYTVTRENSKILADASAGSIEITLPPSAEMSGLDLLITRIDNVVANTVTITAANGETLQGGVSSVVLEEQDQNFRLTAV